jgi:hypothetical protein
MSRFALMTLLAACTGTTSTPPAKSAPPPSVEPAPSATPSDGSAVPPETTPIVSPAPTSGSGSATEPAFADKDLAALATGSVLAFDGKHFAYVARQNGGEAYVSLERFELASAKPRPKSLFKLTVPFDTPIDMAATLKPHSPKLLSALAGYRPIAGTAVGKTTKLPSGDVVAFDENTSTVTFTRGGQKPIKRRLDGGGVTTPNAHYAFSLGDPAGTVIVTTSYTGDVVFSSAFERF